MEVASIVYAAPATVPAGMVVAVEEDNLLPPLAYDDAVKAFPPELHAIPSTASLSAYAQGAPPLIQMGYSTIRIREGEKRPYGNEWQKYCRTPATPAEVAAWSKGRFGIGIACGTIVNGLQVVAIDVDLEGDELEQALASLPTSPMAKFGSKGLTRFYLCDPEKRGRAYTRPRTDGRRGNETLVDFKANGGQVVVPFTVNPITGRSYFWTAGPVPASQLPVLSADDIERFEDTLRHLGWDGKATGPNKVEPLADAEESDGDESIWQEVNRRAFANIPTWAPSLGLYRGAWAGDRYEAVPIWRDGGSGNPPERRKRSLKIHRTGIRDFGTGQGFSPLGLVRQALELPDNSKGRDDAYRWLSDKTGFAADLEIIPIEAIEGMIERSRLRVEARNAEAAATAGGALGDAIPHVGAAGQLIRATPYVWEHASQVPRREWVFGTFAKRKEIAVTVAPGGVGKTALGLVEAISMASGRNLLDVPVEKPMNVWVWNGEEPADELRLRIAAINSHYGISAEDLGGRLFVDNEDNFELVLATEPRSGCEIRVPVVDALIAELRARKIDAMVVDPFVSTHNVKENDNNSIHMAASAWKKVAKGANVAILLAHHSRKSNGQRVTADFSRGADALMSKARAMRTLNPMTEKEADDLGVFGDERHSLFSIDPGDGKVNLVARGGGRRWFKNLSVPMYNHVRGNLDLGDEVGVVVPWTPPEQEVVAQDPLVIGVLLEKLASGFWLARPQAQAQPNWVGVAIAQAFGIDMAGRDWKEKAKTIWKDLLAEGRVTALSEINPDTRQKVKVARPSVD